MQKSRIEKKEREKVAGVKLEVNKLQVTFSDERLIKTIQILPWKPLFGHLMRPYTRSE
jgi:hypothetical protein